MHKHAFIFPGQGSQFIGMGKNLYDNHATAKAIFEQANDILGFHISDIMFAGTSEALKQTNVTQPAVFIHSIAAFSTVTDQTPDMVAGHSLGEFSALVANNTLRFEDALMLVRVRAEAMQHACEINPGTMAAVIGLDDQIVEKVCQNMTETVVAANYNCEGQLVISGTLAGIAQASEQLKAAGAKMVVPLPVGGAFHSPLMAPAKDKLVAYIESVAFHQPRCPVYQNFTAQAVNDPTAIKNNLIQQLTGPVKWKQSVEAMVKDGGTHFTEIGPGKVLQGLVQKTYKEAVTAGIA